MRAFLAIVIVLCVVLVCFLCLGALFFGIAAPTRTQVVTPVPFEYAEAEPFPSSTVHVTAMHKSVRSHVGVGILAIGAMGLIFLMFLVGAAAVALRGSKRTRESYERTDREFQDLFHGFEDLTRRIESLETILLERSGGKG